MHDSSTDGLVTQQPDPLYTLTAAARLLSYSTRTVQRLVQRGELEVVGERALTRVPLSSIREYQARNRRRRSA